MNMTRFVRPEIVAKLPVHQAIETDGKGNLLVILSSGTAVPMTDLIEVSK